MQDPKHQQRRQSSCKHFSVAAIHLYYGAHEEREGHVLGEVGVAAGGKEDGVGGIGGGSA